MSIEVGTIVHYHPRIGGPHNGQEYRVRDLGELGHGERVAWLEGKSGCVALEALSVVEHTSSEDERNG